MATYFEKLKDPRWQKKRLEVLEKAGFSCELCSNSEETLHVHHKQYFKGREPWEYETGQLAVLCESCHKDNHSEEDSLLVACSYVVFDGPYSRETVASLVAGFCGQGMNAPHACSDPDSYVSGELVDAMFSWKSGCLGIVEKIRLLELAKDDFDGLISCLKAYMDSRPKS